MKCLFLQPSPQEIAYNIAGNFRMVQNFAVFTDRVATVKIKTTKISMGGENDDIIVNHRAGERA